MGTDAVEQAIDAAGSGQPVLLPTDTVYGLVTSAARDDNAARVYRLKGREVTQPTALLAGTVEQLLECVPELDERVLRALLPGPYTLVLSNPARRYRWLTGMRTEAIGVRVPELPEPARRVTDAVGGLLATSANDPGGPNPVTLDDVPARIRAAVAAEIDVGPLPGMPSTVIDFTADPPHVIREGLVPSSEAIERVRAALA